MSTSFDIGDLLELSCVFTDAKGVAKVPPTIRLFVKKPDGTVVDLSTTVATDPTTQGKVVASFAPDTVGVYRQRWESDGDPKGAGERGFYVRHRQVAAPA
jgi:hypothetical protein